MCLVNNKTYWVENENQLWASLAAASSPVRRGTVQHLPVDSSVLVHQNLPAHNSSNTSFLVRLCGVCLHAADASVFGVLAVVDTDSSVCAVKDVALWSCASQLIQPDPAGACRRATRALIRNHHLFTSTQNFLTSATTIYIFLYICGRLGTVNKHSTSTNTMGMPTFLKKI